MRLLRKLFGRDTGKVRYEAHRENLHRACDANIAETRKARPKSAPPTMQSRLLRGHFHGPESI